MENYSAEYMISVKVNNLILNSELSEEELNDRITQEGRKKIKDLIVGTLFDPDQKIFKEEIKITHKGI
jgi:hypothetical protein